MVRPFVSLVLAAATTIAGLGLAWVGGAVHYATSAVARVDPGALVALVAGIVLLVGAGATLAIHWVGALVVGAVHGLLGMLALVVPFGNPFGGGIFSPVFQITRMLSKVDRMLGDGATLFYFSGTALVVGGLLVGAALGVRSRRLSGPSSRTAVAVSSVLGGVLLLGAAGLLVTAGGQFARGIVQIFRYDAVAAGLTVLAGVLAGFAGLLLRWSSAGVAIAAGLVLVAGVAAALGAVPPAALGPLLAGYGLTAIVGATALGASLGGIARSDDEVPAVADDL